MNDRASVDRRTHRPHHNFPLLTLSGPVLVDRRWQADRRLNNIKAVFLGRIS